MKEEIVTKKLGLKVIFHFDGEALIEVELKNDSKNIAKNNFIRHKQIKKAIQIYFTEKTDMFLTLHLDLSSFTDMERKVFKAMRKIPFGLLKKSIVY